MLSGVPQGSALASKLASAQDDIRFFLVLVARLWLILGLGSTLSPACRLPPARPPAQLGPAANNTDKEFDQNQRRLTSSCPLGSDVTMQRYPCEIRFLSHCSNSLTSALETPLRSTALGWSGFVKKLRPAIRYMCFIHVSYLFGPFHTPAPSLGTLPSTISQSLVMYNSAILISNLVTYTMAST